jgi:translation elongation factor EF-Ts
MDHCVTSMFRSAHGRAKIVEGRLEKIKNQMALLNQAALSDPNKTVADLVKETIAAVGENIKVRCKPQILNCGFAW